MSDPTYTSENDPQLNLRSDLWPTMSVGQLSRQQELAIDKISKLHSMLGASASPSLINIYGALQQALRDISGLMDARSQQK